MFYVTSVHVKENTKIQIKELGDWRKCNIVKEKSSVLCIKFFRILLKTTTEKKLYSLNDLIIKLSTLYKLTQYPPTL